MSAFLSCRRIARFVACAVSLFAAWPAVAACDPGWEQQYLKGNTVGDKYTASGGVCTATCLEEKRYFYQRAVDLCPDSDTALSNLAVVLEQLGQYPAAEEYYRRAIGRNPKCWQAQLGLGNTAFAAQQYGEAVQYYDRVLAIEPDDSLARLRRGVALRLQQQSLVDAKSIGELIGGPLLIARGIGGVMDDPRLPLRIEFDTDQDTIRPESDGQIRALGEALQQIIKQYPDAAFLIEGHTDMRGSDEHNDDLSVRRARRVAQTLVARFAIPKDHLAIRGFGKRRVLRSGDSDAVNQINRRVEVVRHEASDLPNFIRTATAAPVDSDPAPTSRDDATIETAVFYEDAESRPRKLRDGETLRSGDGFRVFFRPARRGYLYVVQQDSAKKLFPIFPNAQYGYADNLVDAGKSYWVPGENKWLELDKTQGEEAVYFIAASQPREDIADLLRRGSFTQPQQVAMVSPESSYEIKPNPESREFQPRGIAQVREGSRVSVKTTRAGGDPQVLTADALVTRGADFVYILRFRHE